MIDPERYGERHRYTHNRHKDTQIPSLSPVSEQGGRVRDFRSQLWFFRTGVNLATEQLMG